MFICSCILACSSWQSSFWRSASFFCSGRRVLGHRRLGLIGGLGGLQRQRLEVLDLGLELDEPVGERLGRRGVLGGLRRRRRPSAASSAMSTACRALALTFSSSSIEPVQAHLGLLLAGDDVGRLLLEAAVLVLRLGDGLLELDLGVGLLVELPVRLAVR